MRESICTYRGNIRHGACEERMKDGSCYFQCLLPALIGSYLHSFQLEKLAIIASLGVSRLNVGDLSGG